MSAVETGDNTDVTKTKDVKRILEAVDLVLKHSKDDEDCLAITDLAKYVSAMLRFNTFLFLAVDKLIALQQQEKTNNDSSTTAITDTAEALRRYGSLYS